MITKLLRFQLEQLLNRQPTDTELEQAILIINRNEQNISEWSDIRYLLEDWLDNNYFKCLDCEEYYPLDERQTVHDDWDDGNHYCEKCIADARERASFDARSEFGTY